MPLDSEGLPPRRRPLRDYVIGVIGCLLFAIGLLMFLGLLGYELNRMLAGVVILSLGGALVSVAVFPIFHVSEESDNPSTD